MKKVLQIIMLTVACVTMLTAGTALAGDGIGVGVRGGLGTDFSGGVAYGLGVNYAIPTGPKNSVEFGIVLFGGSFEETTTDGFTYKETTDVFVFGALANYLFGYTPNVGKTFFVAGVGLAAISVDWTEESPDDPSLGAPLPGGGSQQSDEGSGAGMVFNLGVGRTFSVPLDLRLDVPVIVTFAAPGQASAVVPTFMLTAGYRFN